MSDFTKLLKKRAQGIPAPVRKSPTPVSTPTSLPPSTITPTVKSPSSPAIREMKMTMQALADAVARDIGSATMPSRPEKADPGMANKDVSNAKQSFNNLILELHAGTVAPEDRFDVNEIMNALQGLKSGSKEFKVSDHWDTSNPNDMTTQYLRAISAFVGGLLNLENVGFAGKQTYYTRDQWQKFKQFIDNIQSGKAAKATPEEKEKWAQSITTHLKGMTKLYNYYFRGQFLSHPYLRPLIEGKAALESYDAPLSVAEQQTIDDGATIPLNIPGVPNSPLMFPLRVLKTPSDFASFLQRIGFDGDPEKALLSIKKQLGMIK